MDCENQGKFAKSVGIHILKWMLVVDEVVKEGEVLNEVEEFTLTFKGFIDMIKILIHMELQFYRSIGEELGQYRFETNQMNHLPSPPKMVVKNMPLFGLSQTQGPNKRSSQSGFIAKVKFQTTVATESRNKVPKCLNDSGTKHHFLYVHVSFVSYK